VNKPEVGSPVNAEWAAPEISANLDTPVGHLGLSAQDLDALHAFLMTLSDE